MQPLENVMINHLPSPAVWSPARATAPRAVLVTLTLALLPLAGGCSRYREDEWSKQWPRRVPAGGMVEFEGKPVEDATVVTVSADGKKEYAALGLTDAAGKFRLKTFRPNDGAIPGKHLVGIEKTAAVVTNPVRGLSPEDQPRVVKNVLPEKYRVYSKSGLEAEVTEKGPNEFVFRLDNSSPVPKADR